MVGIMGYGSKFASQQYKDDDRVESQGAARLYRPTGLATISRIPAAHTTLACSLERVPDQSVYVSNALLQCAGQAGGL